MLEFTKNTIRNYNSYNIKLINHQYEDTDFIATKYSNIIYNKSVLRNLKTALNGRSKLCLEIGLTICQLSLSELSFCLKEYNGEDERPVKNATSAAIKISPISSQGIIIRLKA